MSSPDPLDDDQLADALEGGPKPKMADPDAAGVNKAAPPRSEALSDQELDSLTFMSDMLSVQVRQLGDFTDGTSSTTLAVYHPKSAPRFHENGRPYEVRELDVIRLRDLLNEATRRGLLP